jgi:hypothetical protein
VEEELEKPLREVVREQERERLERMLDPRIETHSETPSCRRASGGAAERHAQDSDATLPCIAIWASCSVMRSGSAAQDSRADGFLARLFFPSGWRLGDGRRSLDRAGSSSLPATRTRCTTSSLRLSAMITSCGSSSTAEEIPGAIPNGSVGVFGGSDLPLCQCPSSAAEGRVVLTPDAHAAGRTEP